MKRKHDPPPYRTRLPAMLMGDEEPVAAPLVAASEKEAAAMLPDHICVVVEGTSRNRVPLLSAAVLGTAALAYGAFKTVMVMPGLAQYHAFFALMVGGGVVLSAFGYRRFIPHRKEYRLADNGIVLEVWHGADLKPWTTRIPWTEIRDYAVSFDRETALLRVESVRGYTISLRDRPPRLSTREFIRRFVDEAERHPRAVRLAEVVSGPDDDVTHDISATGCLGYSALALIGVIFNNLVEISVAQQVVGWAAMGVIGFGLYLWSTLDDYDVAHRDRTSKRMIARLRRWVRRMLNIPVA